MQKTVAADKPFTIQIGAVQSMPAAQRLQKKMQDAGFETYINAMVLSNGVKGYRILVGRFQSKDDALVFISNNNFKQNYPGCFVQNVSQ